MPKGREEPKPNRDVPGPGTYANLEPVRKQIAGPDMSRGPKRTNSRKSNLDPTPGPGYYPEKNVDNAKTFSF